MNPISLQMPEIQEDRQASLPSFRLCSGRGREMLVCGCWVDRQLQSVVLSAVLGALGYKGARGLRALKERKSDFLEKMMHHLET